MGKSLRGFAASEISGAFGVGGAIGAFGMTGAAGFGAAKGGMPAGFGVETGAVGETAGATGFAVGGVAGVNDGATGFATAGVIGGATGGTIAGDGFTVSGFFFSRSTGEEIGAAETGDIGFKGTFFLITGLTGGTGLRTGLADDFAAPARGLPQQGQNLIT